MKKSKSPNSSRVPIYRDAGFELYNAELTARAFELEKDLPANPELFIYSRYRNPTVIDAEEKISRLEKCKWALLTESGMAAIDVALSIFQKKENGKPWLFFSEIYGGTNSYIDSVLIERRGLNINRVEPEGETYNIEKIEKLIGETKPGVLFIETISNPMLIVPDMKRIIEVGQKHGTRIIIDNTFATPYLVNPLDSGADLVIHSATKYLGGHGNITAGVVCGNSEELRRESVDYRKFTGHLLSPDDAYRLTTQMESFNLRVKQQFRNSQEVAELLNNSHKIENVWFPGLKSHPTHEIARELFSERGYGAIITFDLAGNNPGEKRAARDKFIDSVSSRIKLIPTLGDSHTILMPVEPVWGFKYPEPGMIRLSVGFEETGDLLEIIEMGLG